MIRAFQLPPLVQATDEPLADALADWVEACTHAETNEVASLGRLLADLLGWVGQERELSRSLDELETRAQAVVLYPNRPGDWTALLCRGASSPTGPLNLAANHWTAASNPAAALVALTAQIQRAAGEPVSNPELLCPHLTWPGYCYWRGGRCVWCDRAELR